MDAGTRAFIIAVYSDFFPCIFSPAFLLYSAPVFKEKMLNSIDNLKGRVADSSSLELNPSLGSTRWSVANLRRRPEGATAPPEGGNSN